MAPAKDLWGPIFGGWNHFGAIAVCPNGDVLAVWYTTDREEGRECAQAACRLRAGSDKFDPPSFFSGTPDCNTHAPVLLGDGKKLYHFFTQSFAGWDDSADCLRTSDDGKTWPHVRKVVGPTGSMSLGQAPNGPIYQLGPSGGAPDRCVAYNEAWLKEGNPVK